MVIFELDSTIASLKYSCNKELDSLLDYCDTNDKHLITAVKDLIDNAKINTATKVLSNLYHVSLLRIVSKTSNRAKQYEIKGLLKKEFTASFSYLRQLDYYINYRLDLYKYTKHPQ